MSVVTIGYNTTLLPSVNVIAHRMFCGAKDTSVTHSHQSLIKQQIKSQQQQTRGWNVIDKYVREKVSVVTIGYNTTLLPSVNVIAHWMFCGAKYTCVTHSHRCQIYMCHTFTSVIDKAAN